MVSTKTLGPWPGGLNLISNRDRSIFLSPQELGEALNVVYTPEGFIEPRPGYKKLQYDFGTFDTIEAFGQLELPNGSTIVFVQTLSGSGSSRQAKIYTVTDKATVALIYTPPPDTVFTHVMSYKSINANHSGVFLFADKVSKSVRNPAFDLSGTWAVINPTYLVPPSNVGFIVKDRLFLFDYQNSTMWWSPANYILDFNRVDAASYGDDSFSEEPIEVTIPEDGIKTVQFLSNNFYIFKKTKTYMFTYQADPFVDGYLRKINEQSGAYDSAIIRNSVVLVNNRGVFRMDGQEFVDIQRQLNLRFEIPIDHSNIKSTDIFLTTFNDNVLVGFRDSVNNPGKVYHYLLSGKTGGWSQWSFDYAANIFIARPGQKHYRAQGPVTSRNILLASSFSRGYLVYTDYKPGAGLPYYHLDGDVNDPAFSKLWVPPVVIKTSANFGNSPIKFAKLYRTFIRFYMSDLPKDVLVPDEVVWELSINYNAYAFEYDSTVDGNPVFTLHSNSAEFAEINTMPGTGADGNTTVYTRTYQVPIPQQRIKEFVVELKRKTSSIPTDTALNNIDADRPIKNGYYFLLSNIWIDYQDKAGI